MCEFVSVCPASCTEEGRYFSHIWEATAVSDNTHAKTSHSELPPTHSHKHTHFLFQHKHALKGTHIQTSKLKWHHCLMHSRLRSTEKQREMIHRNQLTLCVQWLNSCAVFIRISLKTHAHTQTRNRSDWHAPVGVYRFTAVFDRFSGAVTNMHHTHRSWVPTGRETLHLTFTLETTLQQRTLNHD